MDEIEYHVRAEGYYVKDLLSIPDFRFILILLRAGIQNTTVTHL